jgi:pilus assembly protein CpaB
MLDIPVTTETERAARRTAPQAEPQPPPRRGLLTRVKLGHVVAIVAGLLAAVTTLAVLRSNQSTVQVVTAAAPIASGAVITAADVVVEEVLLSPQFGAHFVTADEIDRVAGSVARRSIIAGEPLLDSDLGAVAALEGLRAMSVPIEEGRAVAGGLQVGDRVDVIAVVDGLARFIATDVEVLGVPTEESTGLTQTSGFAPTLAVNDEQALQIASALGTAEVHLVRSTGSPEVTVDEVAPIEGTDERAPVPGVIP